jgi:thiol-disulfide isomerase/thioredoxin
MALTPSKMLALGTDAPAFRLPDAAGRVVTSDDFHDATALLVAFWCNHCPYVQHVRDPFVRFANEYAAKGIAIVAIKSNDASRPGNATPVTGADLRAACDALLAGCWRAEAETVRGGRAAFAERVFRFSLLVGLAPYAD